MLDTVKEMRREGRQTTNRSEYRKGGTQSLAGISGSFPREHACILHQSLVVSRFPVRSRQIVGRDCIPAPVSALRRRQQSLSGLFIGIMILAWDAVNKNATTAAEK